MRVLIYQIVCLLMVLSVPGASYGQDSAIRPVMLMTVDGDSRGVTRRFFGQVVARQSVDLAFQVSGQIVDFPVTEGEEIAAGSLIAALDLEPFELQLEQARLQFDQAERALDRVNRLASTVSDVAREDAETQMGLTRVALRNAEVALKNATLLAPFDALVAARNVGNFTTVGQGNPVVRLHDMSEVRIEIDVPEVLFQRAGEDADVSLVARFPTSDRTYPLSVREFNAEASAVGQTFRLTLGMARPEELLVLPGSSVTVIVTVSTGEIEQLVPASAIRIGNDGRTSAMRFVPGDGDTGRLEEIEIEVAATRDGDFNVVSGIEPGDEIVRAGAHAVRDGEIVRRFVGFAN